MAGSERGSQAIEAALQRTTVIDHSSIVGWATCRGC